MSQKVTLRKDAARHGEGKRAENEDLQRGHEYAASIINAYKGGELFEFNGNVSNTGIVTNLPHGCCVSLIFVTKHY